MNKVKQMLTSELLIAALLSVMAYSGITRPAVQPQQPVRVEVVIGKASKIETQATIYSADYCIPCHKYVKDVKPKLEKNGYKFANRGDAGEQAAEVVIDKTGKDFERLGIDTIPCTIIRRNGKEIKRFYGAVSADEFSKRYNEVAKGKD